MQNTPATILLHPLSKKSISPSASVLAIILPVLLSGIINPILLSGIILLIGIMLLISLLIVG